MGRLHGFQGEWSVDQSLPTEYKGEKIENLLPMREGGFNKNITEPYRELGKL